MPVSVKNKTEEAPDIRHIKIPQIAVRQAILEIVGISPLIMHKWSEKAAKQLEDKVTGKAKAQRGNVDPDQAWKDAAYVIPGKEKLPDWEPGKYYFPAEAFKASFLYGVGQLDDVKSFPKTKATGWVYVNDNPTLMFESVQLRRDIGRKPVQPIYRPQFNNWSAELCVGYNAGSISLDQVVALFDLGGFSGGIGEWRPSSPQNKTGSYGRFRVGSVKDAS